MSALALIVAAPIWVGTLSTNACEAEVAPVYTAAVTALERAERYLVDGRLTRERVASVRALIGQARIDLDATCAGPALDSARFAAAKAAVYDAQVVLSGAR